ncbi:MAG TPA: glycosyltransferase family 2 protein [Bdellovibrionota bacterium]|nr:glycosyltransferase family 2 protein [Bdellovibrionota bacterium]
MKKVPSTLSIVVSVFNEQDFVERSLRGLSETKLPAVSKKEIIVVDDGSTDGTRDILLKLQKEIGFLLLHLPKNQGKGSALRAGIARVSGDLVVFHDADLEYDPADFNQMLVPLLSGKADVVYGSRFVGSEIRRLLFFWHHVGNRIISTLVNMVTNLNFSDVETCYKMFRADALKSLSLQSDRFGIEIEMTIKAAKKGLRFYEVPVSYNGRTYAEGKKITWRDGIGAVYSILRYGLFD